MVSAAPLASLLGKTALFGSLTQADRLTIAGQMRKNVFKQGQTIFARGDTGNEVYLVVEGRVRLSVFSPDGRMLSFKHANPGEMFGEVACFDGGVRSADAVALTRVETMALAQAQLNRLVEMNPRVARAAIAYLCNRLRDTSEQSEAIALHSIEARLARFFLSRCKQVDAGGGGKPSLDIGMSQSELGLLVGASRQKVNAALAVLENEGAVRRAGGRVICNTAKLQRLAASS